MNASGRRIGVYICWCGGNISDVVNVKKVVEEIRKEPNVVVARDFMFMCSEAGQKLIINDIKELGLDAVVVASCSPKLHEATFRSTVVRAGLNPYMYYHANIREQVSWAHGDSPEDATEKAIRHVRMAVAYLRRAEPLEKIKVRSTASVLIIGGGIAGLKAAYDLARMGVTVHLVEKEPYLGGNTAKLPRVYPWGTEGWRIVSSLIEKLRKMDNVAIYTNSEVVEIKGYIGNFEAKIGVKPRYFKGKCDRLHEAINACPLSAPDEWSYGVGRRKAIIPPPYPGAYPEIPYIDMSLCNKCEECLKICGDKIDLDMKPYEINVKVGSVIVATGFKPYKPKKNEYGYGTSPQMVTLQEFQHILSGSQKNNGYMIYNGREIRTVVFIYCVGSRQPPGEGNTYCSRYCCNATMHTTLSLLEKHPKTRVYHLYRDIRTYGKNELMYENASRKGVVFIKYSDSYDKEYPKITLRDDGKIVVRTRDLLTEGELIDIPADMVVLVTGMEPQDNNELNNILKIPIGNDGFYQEIHPKLRPVETTIAGYFIAGACQGPKDISETLASSSAAAAKAAGIALRKELELEPFIAKVNEEKCNATGNCIRECPYSAITLRQTSNGPKAWVNPAVCKGCGACVAVCPTEAIQLQGLTNKQIVDMIKAGGLKNE